MPNVFGIIGAVFRECLSLGLCEECIPDFLGPFDIWRIQLAVATIVLKFVSKGERVTGQNLSGLSWLFAPTVGGTPIYRRKKD